MKPCTVTGFICGGWVKDAHGLKGHLYIQVYSPELDWADRFKELHLYNAKKQESHSFPVKEWSPFKDGFRVLAEGLQDRTAAEAFKGHHFLIPEDWLESQEGDQVFLAQIKGFEVLDQGKSLGCIEDFATNGVQDLLVVGDYLIPLVDEFIVEIDFDKTQIHMDLPKGLIEINQAQPKVKPQRKGCKS